MEENGNQPLGQNRRYKLGKLWLILLALAYYAGVFFAKDIGIFIEYAKNMTLGLAAIIGGLTLTDAVRKQ